MAKNQKYLDILFTDIKLHTIKPRKPVSLGRKISKSITSKKAGRAFSRNIKITKDGKLELSIPLGKEFIDALEKARKQGKQLRIIMPKNGIPVYFGKDVIERLQAVVKRQRKRRQKT